MIVRLRFFLTFLCLNGTNPPRQAEAAVWCQSRRFERGEIITHTIGGSQKTYCGSPIGVYLAVRENLLFHLQCSPTASSPTKATATLIKMTDRATRLKTFDNEAMCDVTPAEAATTEDNAHRIAQLLVGKKVPCNLESCNAQHYAEYLAYGRVRNPYAVDSSCPVFRVFDDRTSINMSVFKLAGTNVYYDWPQSGGALSAVPEKQTKRPSWKFPNSPFRKKSPSPARVSVVDKKGGGGGHAGHGSGRSRPNPAFYGGHATSSASKRKPWFSPWRSFTKG